MCNKNIFLSLVLILFTVTLSFSQRRALLDDLYLGGTKVSNIVKDSINPYDSLSLATPKAIAKSEIWSYQSRDSLQILVKGGYPTIVGSTIIPAGSYIILDTTIIRSNPGPVTIPDGTVTEWVASIVYDSLQNISYNGIIWQLQDTIAGLGLIPGVSNKWIPITIENPVSGSGDEFEVAFYKADGKTLQTIPTFKIQSNRLQVPELLAASVNNPKGGSNEIGAVIDSLGKPTVGDTLLIDRGFSATEVKILSKQLLESNIVTQLDTSTITKTIAIPPKDSLLDNSQINIIFEESTSNKAISIESDPGEFLLINGTNRRTQKYLLEKGDKATIKKTDDGLVIDVNKRQIAPLTISDFLDRHYFEGDDVKFNNIRYKVQKSVPTEIESFDRLVYKVRDIAPYGENLLTKSRELRHTGAQLYDWNISDAIRQSGTGMLDVTLDKYGKKGGDVIHRDESGGVRFDQKVNNFVPSGGKITYSFDYKKADNSIHDNIDIASFRLNKVGVGDIVTSPTVTLSDDRSGWHTIMYTFTTPEDLDTTWSVLTYLTMDIGDSLYVDNFQLERSPSQSEFKLTTSAPVTASDSLYLIIQPENGLINLNKAFQNTETDHVTLQQALDYCEYLEDECDGVIPPMTGMTLRDSVLIPSRTRIPALAGTIFTIDLNDSTKSAITNRRDDAYTVGQGVDNVEFVFVSDAFAAIKTNNFLNQYYNNIKINGAYNIGVDSISYGVYAGINDGSDAAIGLFMKGGSITGCQTGIHFENVGNDHILDGIIVSRNTTAISGDATNMLQLVPDIENNDVAYDLSDSNESGNNGWTLLVPYLENATVKINNWGTFGFIGGRTSGGDFEMTKLNHLFLLNNRLSSASTLETDPYNLTRMTAIGNEYFPVDNYYKDFNLYKNTVGNVFLQNYSRKGVYLGLRYNSIGRLYSYQPVLNHPILRGTTHLGGILELGNVTITGKRQNLVVQPDSLYSLDQINETLEIQNNVIVAPDGSTTADLIIGQIDQSGNTGFSTIDLTETVSQGSQVTISFWAKDMKEVGYSTGEILVRFGTGFAYTIGPTYSKEWKRHELIIDSTGVSDNKLTRRVVGVSLGDSIAYWGWAVNYGDRALGDEPSGINNTQAELNVRDTDSTLLVNGNMQINGVLKDSDGDVGTTGQYLTPNGVGGMNYVNGPTGTISTGAIGEIAVYTSTNTIDGSPILSDKTTYVEVTAPIRTVDGSTSVPVYSFINDTDTGIRRLGADSIAIVLGDAIAAELTGTGINLAAGDTYRVNGIPLFTNGNVTATNTNGSGQLVIAHGLGTIPTSETVSFRADVDTYYYEATVDATNITITIIDRVSGLPAATTPVSLSWTVFK